VLGNKNDLEGAATAIEIIRALCVLFPALFSEILMPIEIDTWTKSKIVRYP
jgi:hypothetical protein